MWSRVLAKVIAHVEIMRPYTVSYAGLLGLAGAALGSGRRLRHGRALSAALITMCGWLAGHYVGDYFDRDIDARSKPGRPLPSGRVSPREAIAGMLTLIGLGNAAALALGRGTLLLAVLTTGLGVAYSKAFKGQALLGNLDRGILGACAVLFGGLSAGQPLATPRRGGAGVALPLGLFAMATICHDGATNLVGAVRDVAGDRAAGCRTLPVVYGVPRSVDVAAGLAAVSTALSLPALLLARPARLALVLYAAALLLAVAVYGRLLGLRTSVTRPQALAAHKVLVVERLLLAGAMLAARAPRLAAALLAASVPASVILQAAMRDRHERQAATL